jgi:hypothetical protein
MASPTTTSKLDSVYEELWSNKDVRELHARFDTELNQAKSQQDFEALMRRFFGPTGLMEQGLDVCRGADVPFEDVMKSALEFLQFKYLIQMNFFMQGYSEELVKDWWKSSGPKPFDQENSYLDESVKLILQRFNEDAQGAKTLSELEQVGGLYLSPTGVIAREFAKAESLEERQQIQRCAELFQVRGHMESTLFAIDFATKSEAWTVPFVRGLVYSFERELKDVNNDKAAEALKTRFIGKDGLVEKAVVRAKKEKNTTAEEELKKFGDSLNEFFQGENK